MTSVNVIDAALLAVESGVPFAPEMPITIGQLNARSVAVSALGVPSALRRMSVHVVYGLLFTSSSLKMTTPVAPAVTALRTFSLNCSVPRLISAILPLTDAGKSAGLPMPQKTYGPVSSPCFDPSSPPPSMYDPFDVTYAFSPAPTMYVDKTFVPGAVSASSGP